MRNTNFEAMERYFWEAYEGGQTNLRMACEEVYEEFERVANYPSNIRNIPNTVDRMADYFMGLPSPFHPDYQNYRIEEILREWGIIKDGHPPSRVNKMVEGWWSYWASWVIKIVEGKRL